MKIILKHGIKHNMNNRLHSMATTVYTNGFQVGITKIQHPG
ncbi:MAG: hypothetical protein RR636_14615 [Clostridium sp.]